MRRVGELLSLIVAQSGRVFRIFSTTLPQLMPKRKLVKGTL